MIRRVRTGAVEVVEIDRPPLNLFGSRLVSELRDALAAVASSGARALVLGCTGAGADVRELVELTEDTARDFITKLHGVCRAVVELDVPVIAAVDGPCFGAHLELAAACDLRVCSQDATFAMPEVRVGIPSVIDAFWLPAICGRGEANRLLFTGDVVDAEEARRIGLVNRIGADAVADARAWAFELAELSPVALRQQKRVLRDWAADAYAAAASASIERFVQTFERPEAHEAMRAFLEKRPPRFRDPE